MGLNFAIEELYATGWSTLDSTGCAMTTDGRLYPDVDRTRHEFDGGGALLTIRHVEEFECYRAEWSEAAGAALGAVVGQSQQEAAVYALAQWRRSMSNAQHA